MATDMAKIYLHPFKEAIRAMLRYHFHEDIAKRFWLEFEVNIYNDFSEPIWKQKRDQNLVLEVYYMANEAKEFICDLYSWESKAQVEHKLLQYITDKYKSGKIGQDWIMEGGEIRINPDILSGKHETPDDTTPRVERPKRRVH